jgi:hypothetical protein
MSKFDINPLPLEDEIKVDPIPTKDPTADISAVPEPGFTVYDDPRVGRIQVPYKQQGGELVPGTRVLIAGDRSPDSPEPTGTVIGHNRAIAGQAERRHRVAMDQGGEWTCDFTDLTTI